MRVGYAPIPVNVSESAWVGVGLLMIVQGRTFLLQRQSQLALAQG